MVHRTTGGGSISIASEDSSTAFSKAIDLTDGDLRCNFVLAQFWPLPPIVWSLKLPYNRVRSVYLVGLAFREGCSLAAQLSEQTAETAVL